MVPAVQFFLENPRVDDHAIAENEIAVFVSDSGWNLMQLEGGISYYDCVSCVVASLEANSPGRLLGKLVYGLALAFITPLGSKHDAGRHRSLGQYGGRINALADVETDF